MKRLLCIFLLITLVFTALAGCSSDESTDNASISGTWKEAYINYIESVKDTSDKYCLIYLDADDVPELFISGKTSSTICTYLDSGIITTTLPRIGGVSYIPKSGLIYNCHGESGQVFTDIIELENGEFIQIFYGESVSHSEIVTDDNGDKSYTDNISYYIGKNKRVVSEDEYNSAILEIYDLSKASPLSTSDDNTMQTYDQIITSIKEHK